ncbi:hypothetical protein [Nocardia tengchongensis]|uniref:hypothetical protein n=1 Tax=Nocardia tengchongensis TaxID=2055889 RepID=UPI00361A6DD4
MAAIIRYFVIVHRRRVAWHSGSDRASDALESACDGTAVAGRFRNARGLGDEACTASRDEDNGATGFASAIVRRGSDLLWVDCYRHPGTIDQAEHAVPEVVSVAFAAVP